MQLRLPEDAKAKVDFLGSFRDARVMTTLRLLSLQNYYYRTLNTGPRRRLRI